MLADAPEPTPEEGNAVLAATENVVRTLQRLTTGGPDANELTSSSPSEGPTNKSLMAPRRIVRPPALMAAKPRRSPKRKTLAEKNSPIDAHPPQLEPGRQPDKEQIICHRNGGDMMNASHCRDTCRDRNECSDFRRWARTAGGTFRRRERLGVDTKQLEARAIITMRDYALLHVVPVSDAEDHEWMLTGWAAGVQGFFLHRFPFGNGARRSLATCDYRQRPGCQPSTEGVNHAIWKTK